MPLILLALVVAATDPNIVVTAARVPVPTALSGTAISVLDAATIDAVALPLGVDLLRLVPSVAVASTGPLGSQTQVRIRGAEASQTLVFIDGIKANDPASGGEFRWETLARRRHRQASKCCAARNRRSGGSEAIGGVVNVITDARPPMPGTQRCTARPRPDRSAPGHLGGGGNYGTERRRHHRLQASLSQFEWYRHVKYQRRRQGWLYELGPPPPRQLIPPVSEQRNRAQRSAMSTPTTQFRRFRLYRSVKAKPTHRYRAEALKPLHCAAMPGSTRCYDDHWTQPDRSGLSTIPANNNFDRWQGLPEPQRRFGSSRLGYQTSATFKTGSIENLITGAVEHTSVQTFKSTDADPVRALEPGSYAATRLSLIADYRADLRTKLLGQSAPVSATTINSQYAEHHDFPRHRSTGIAAGPARPRQFRRRRC